MDVLIKNANNAVKSLPMLNDHVLNVPEMRVNDDFWLEFSSVLIKLKRARENEHIMHEKDLNDLCGHIWELSGVKTEFESSSNVIAKSLAYVRKFDVIVLVRWNSRKEIQGLNSALGACALEADRAGLR